MAKLLRTAIAAGALLFAWSNCPSEAQQVESIEGWVDAEYCDCVLLPYYL